MDPKNRVFRLFLAIDGMVKFGVSNKLNRFYPPSLSQKWVIEEISELVLLHYPTPGLFGNLLRLKNEVPDVEWWKKSPDHRGDGFISNCWATINNRAGFNVGIEQSAYDVAPYQGAQHDGGVYTDVGTSIIDLPEFIALQLTLINEFKLRIIAAFGITAHTFLMNNKSVGHDNCINFFTGSIAHPMCLRPQFAKSRNTSNMEGWKHATSVNVSDVVLKNTMMEALSNLTPTEDEMQRQRAMGGNSGILLYNIFVIIVCI